MVSITVKAVNEIMTVLVNSGQEPYSGGIIRTRIRSVSLIVQAVTAPEIFITRFTLLSCLSWEKN